MTWKEFKAKVEAEGAKDDMVIGWINVSGCDCPELDELDIFVEDNELMIQM